MKLQISFVSTHLKYFNFFLKFFFRRSVTAVLSQLDPNDENVDGDKIEKPQTKRKSRAQLVISDSDSEKSSEDSDDTDENTNPLERFLCAWGLDEYSPM